jgi:hypothetical protein
MSTNTHTHTHTHTHIHTYTHTHSTHTLHTHTHTHTHTHIHIHTHIHTHVSKPLTLTNAYGKQMLHTQQTHTRTHTQIQHPRCAHQVCCVLNTWCVCLCCLVLSGVWVCVHVRVCVLFLFFRSTVQSLVVLDRAQARCELQGPFILFPLFSFF